MADTAGAELILAVSDADPAGRDAAELILALDVGGTTVRGALLDRAATVVDAMQRPAGGRPGAADPGLAVTAAVTAELAARAAAAGPRVTAVGAGFPEYVQGGQLTSSEVLAWHEQPALLLDRLVPGVVVTVESDVRCGAIAEYHALARHLPADPMLYVSWGTGLSSTLLIGGNCLAGARGEAIALGEWEVAAAADPSWAGTLEAFASGSGIARRFALATGTSAAGDAADGEPAPDGAAEVFARAASGDDGAAAVVATAMTAVAHALAAATALLDPAIIVLGGGIGSGPAANHPVLLAHFARLTGRRAHAPTLVPAALGHRSGLLGAALVTGRVTSAVW